MKGSIGNAMVMNIVITFIILTTAFLVASISYSKAFKVKTNIIDIIEKYNGNFDDGGNDSTIISEINKSLGTIGYRTGGSCSVKEGTNLAATSAYDVCIYRMNVKDASQPHTYRGNYYKVVVYMYLDLPIIGDTIKIPVSGETRAFFQDVEN